jgi:hypothetical protein
MNLGQNLNRPKKAAPSQGGGSANLIEQIRTFEFGEQTKKHLLRYFLYVSVFGLFYIANAHYADRRVRQINQLQKKTEELRSDYTTLKAKYILEGKRTLVRDRVQPLGLGESNEPAYELIIND